MFFFEKKLIIITTPKWVEAAQSPVLNPFIAKFSNFFSFMTDLFSFDKINKI